MAMEVDCEEDYPEGPHTYLDIDYFTDQLLEDIVLPMSDSNEESFWSMVQSIKD